MNKTNAWMQRFVAPTGLFVFAFLVRALPWPEVLDGNRVYFFGTDAYYHMRRVFYSLANFPATLDFDPYLNFPHGAKTIWTPLLDVMMTFVLLPFHHFGGELAAERAAVWVPPLLGSCTVLTLYFLAKRYFGFSIALVSSLVLCFLSAHFWYSRIGFIDHHVLVALAATLLLAALFSLLDHVSRKGDFSRSLFRHGALVGALLAVSLLVWPGCLLHVGLVEIALLIFLMSRSTRAEALHVAQLLTLVHAVAMLLVLPSGLQASWPQLGDFAPTVISRFQPWMFGALVLHSASCSTLWRWGTAGNEQKWRVLQSLILGVGLLGASLLVFPGLLVGASKAWQWMALDEFFQAMVMESQPLFSEGGKFGVGTAERQLSRFIYLFPVALLALAWETRRSPQRPVLWTFLFWCVALACATLAQRRFYNSFSVAYALVIGWSAVRAYALLVERFRESRIHKVAAGTIVAAILAFLMAPTFAVYDGTLDNQWAKLRGQPATLPKWIQGQHRLADAARWLRTNSPPTSGVFNAEEEPEYGVLNVWENGHIIKYEAQRPTVVGNFGDDLGGDNFELSYAYFQFEEDPAVELLEQLKVRYVLHRVQTKRALQMLNRASMLYRLSETNLIGLAHHRLLYESPLEAPGVETSDREYRLFEVVKGARLVGRAPPHQYLTARISCQTNRGRKFSTRLGSRANADGVYTITLPYSTRGSPPAVLCDPSYAIVSGGQEREVAIDEEHVLNGSSVEGPSFGAAGTE